MKIKKQLFYQVSGSTMLSRILGLMREILLARYLGEPGIISDAFLTAFKIPNMLRKIFAEGALSAAMVPSFVATLKKEDKPGVNALMTLSFIIIEGILLGLCIFMCVKADLVMRLIVPGWYTASATINNPANIPPLKMLGSVFGSFFTGSWTPAPQVAYAISYLRILMPLILFLSCSALLAAALQSVHHFFVPSFSPVLLNIVFIAGIIFCGFFSLPVYYLCLFIIAGGALQLVLHYYKYKELGFGFAKPTVQTWHSFKAILIKFLPCLISMSVMEVNLFIDTSIGSYLPEGSVSLIHYANRFVGIPLGVFAVAFSTILFPSFSRTALYAPARLQFYLHEAIKFILWVTLPLTFFLMFYADSVFETLFLSSKFTMEHVLRAGSILRAFALGLCFYSINKVVLNLYYARHNTFTPMLISIIATVSNFILSMYVFLPFWGAYGIAFATTLSAALQTVLFMQGLKSQFGYKLYLPALGRFLKAYAQQLIVTLVGFRVCYAIIERVLTYAPAKIGYFFLHGLGFWFWATPLAGATMLILYFMAKKLHKPLHYLEHIT